MSAIPAPNHSVSRLTLMVTHTPRTADVLSPALSDTFYCLSLNGSEAHLFTSLCVSLLPMGRRSWATDEQLKFLHSYTSELSKAKAGIGHNVLYLQIAEDFLVRWEAEPLTSVAALAASRAARVAPSTTPDTSPTTPDTSPITQADPRSLTPEELKAYAKTRLQNVCFILVCVFHH